MRNSEGALPNQGRHVGLTGGHRFQALELILGEKTGTDDEPATGGSFNAEAARVPP